MLLIRAGSWDSLLTDAYLSLTHGLIDLANISSTDKYTPLDVLLEEIVLTGFGIDLSLVRRELRLSGNDMVLIAFDLGVEKDAWGGLT